MANPTVLLDLASTISNAALAITRHSLDTSTPPPSFIPLRPVNGVANGNGAVQKQPTSEAAQKETLDAAASLIQAATDLQILVSGPENYLKSLSYGYHDITALAVVIEFNLAQHVPLDSEISFKELSLVSGAPLGRLERILRLLFVRRIFHEPRPGYIAHTTASERLVTNPELTAFLGHCTHEAFPAASRLVDSLRKYPNTEEPSQAGFNVAFGTEDPLFTFLTKNPDRFERFNQGMAGLSKSGGRSVKQVIEGFPWGDLGEATVVDVGGGNGHVSIALAEAYPSLSFIVQDLEGAITSGAASLPASLQDRITFEVHNMFTPQTRQGIDVFYLRHILHDWPDDWAVKILKNLVPALKPTSRIIISDSVIPPPDQLHGLHERFVRYLDLQMMVLHNARERTEGDFAELLRRADERLRIKKVWRGGHDAAAGTIVEAILVE
ncbi:S-adenosyl-L-methionine-dependent methyltransferase [Aspergillus pseudodeflectus]|uniref:S-adenosyl-L-methionine-dependent methyltransferase n=1 Tax=Aspergillus pseudodeflectus TaxID=176178 RepID=A0ABR4L4X5_9EURO